MRQETGIVKNKSHDSKKLQILVIYIIEFVTKLQYVNTLPREEARINRYLILNPLRAK